MPHQIQSARQEDRRPLALQAEFEIAPVHREQIRFSPSSNAPQRHVTVGRSIDVSPAGIGLICEQFVPRMTEGIVRLFVGRDGDSRHQQPVFEQRAKIRRVSLRVTDKPSYLLGAAFLDPPKDLEKKVNQLLEQAGAAAQSAPREADHA